MAASQGQAIRPLLGLLRHLCCLVLQHGEALQLPVLAICQLWRGEAVVSDSHDQMRILMTMTPQRENGLWALCCPAPGSCLTHRTFSTALGGCILPIIQRGQRRLREVSMLKVTLLVGGQSQAAHWSEPPGPAPVPLGDVAWVSGVHSAAPGEEGLAGEAGSSGVHPDCTPQAEDATAAAEQGTQSDGETDGR